MAKTQSCFRYTSQKIIAWLLSSIAPRLLKL